jgi:hypothetical protein
MWVAEKAPVLVENIGQSIFKNGGLFVARLDDGSPYPLTLVVSEIGIFFLESLT